MIKLEVNEQDRILTIEMKDMVSEADIDNAMDALQARYPAVGLHLRGGEHGGFNILFDWLELVGWEKGAKTLGTVTGKTIGDAVRKIAIVAAAQFAGEQPRVADIAPTAQVRLFAPDQRDVAVAWLRR